MGVLLQNARFGTSRSLETPPLHSGRVAPQPLSHMPCPQPVGARAHLQQRQLVAASAAQTGLSWRAPLSTAEPVRAAPWGVDPVVVVGAGIAGLATARALRKVGIPVLVLESGSGPFNEGAAIGLWSNAWRALDVLDAAQPLREAHVNVERLEMCTPEGRTLRAFDYKDCGPAGALHEYRFLRRSVLVAALAEGLPQDCVRYGCKVVRVVEGHGGAAEVELAGGERVRCSAVVGADGVRSAGAAHLGLGAPNITGYTALRGIGQFPDGQSFMPPNVMRQVLGRGVRFGVSMMTANECDWFITVNGAVAPDVAASPERLADFTASLVRGWGCAAEHVVRATPPADISSKRLGDRWTMGAFGHGVVTLVGDAAHPMTPNLGQGGCTAIEDAVVLARTLSAATCSTSRSRASNGDTTQQTVAAALRRYEAERSRRCLPISVRAWAYGEIMQLPQLPVCAVRDYYIRHLFSPADLLDHTAYDCGTLQPPAVDVARLA